MGSESKPNVDGVAMGVQMSDNVKKVVIISPATTRPYAVLLRFLGFALTLVATVIVGVSKESHTFSLGGFNLKATAKWQYMSAFVYFLVSNAIACSYATASLVITANPKNSENNMTSLAITTVDLVMTALLFSANGATAAVGIIGRDGNSHVQWMKVCNVFDAFCRHMTAALVLSLIASTAFLCLVALSIFRLHGIKLSSR